MRYFLIRDAMNTILTIHKKHDSALVTFENMLQSNQLEEYIDVSKITTNEHGKVIQIMILQSYTKDAGKIIHSYHIEPTLLSQT